MKVQRTMLMGGFVWMVVFGPVFRRMVVVGPVYHKISLLLAKDRFVVLVKNGRYPLLPPCILLFHHLTSFPVHPRSR